MRSLKNCHNNDDKRYFWTKNYMGFGIGDLLWIFLLLTSLQPLWQKRQIEYRRLRALQQFQQERKSRVILLIHRQDVY